MFSYEEGTFQTFDKLKLFYRTYFSPDAHDWLLILHGQGEHSGRYEKFPTFLAGQKISIALLDHRGHGRSEGKDVYVDRFDDYLKDVSAFQAFLERRYPTARRIVLFGNSLGGLMAIHWAFAYPERLKALILSSPCLGLLQPEWILRLNHFLNFVFPGYVYRNPVYPPFLTHDPEEIEKYKQDGLVKRRISARLLDEMVRAARILEKRETCSFPFPVHILMAGDERIVDPKKTKSFFGKIHAPQKDLKIFPGFYHEIFNETSQADALEALKMCLKTSRSF